MPLITQTSRPLSVYITYLQFFAEPVLELLECTDIGVSPVADAFVLNKAAPEATGRRLKDKY